MPRRTPRVVVLTGASSGIGRATALAFAEKERASLVLAARRGEALEDLAVQCRGLGSQVLVAPLDVSDAEAVEALATDAVRRFGRIDVWVNDAAVSLYGRLEEVPPRLWRRVLEVNALGVYHGSRAALPVFRRQGGGVLVNVSSILGKMGAPEQSAYVASKHAILAIGECVRQETRDVRRLHVCDVLPGPVDTPLFNNAANWSGRKVVAPPAAVDARRVAAAVVRVSRRPRREVIVSGSGRLSLLNNRLAPGLTEKGAARALEVMQFDNDVPAPRTEGNLFQPRRDEAVVDGGWAEHGSSWLAGRRLLLAASAVGAVVAVRRAAAGR